MDSMDNFTPSNTPSREDDPKFHLKSRSRSPSMASDMEPIEVRQSSEETYLCVDEEQDVCMTWLRGLTGNRCGEMHLDYVLNADQASFKFKYWENNKGYQTNRASVAFP